MASILQPFTVVAKAVRAFFVSDVHVRRGNHGLEVVLDDPDAKPDPGSVKARKARSQPDPQSENNLRDLRRMQESLKRLLDGAPAHRKTLVHLAFMERALAKKGLRSLHKVPYDVLKRALMQLEGLVLNWSDEGLAALRSKMAVAVMEREPDPSTRVAGPPVEAANSVMDTAPLAHPVQLEGEEAAEAEAALLAAYGAMAMSGAFNADNAGQPAPHAALEMQGELNSPSAKALSKSARQSADVPSADFNLKVPDA